MHLTPFSKVTTTLDKVTDPSTGYKFINQYCMLEEIGRGTFGKVCVLELYELWMMVLVCTCVRVWCERADTAVFFWIETLSYPKSKMYGRKSGCTMENLILGSVIKIFAKRCMENYVWRWYSDSVIIGAFGCHWSIQKIIDKVTGQNPKLCMETFRYYEKVVDDFDTVSIQKKTAVNPTPKRLYNVILAILRCGR
jgi:hypothetical protein